jgi:histidyl-tRNA synthetase
VLASVGVVEEARKLTILRAIDKLDKFGVPGVRLLLGAGRKDESGDFTKGAELSGDQIDIVLDTINLDLSTDEKRAAALFRYQDSEGTPSAFYEA